MAHKKHVEPHIAPTNRRLNALRAAVLGANDGIVSVAGIVVGVAGASNSRTAILTAGVAGLAAGALSMAAGEYISVSSQSDLERTILHRERKELEETPEEEFDELIGVYESKGLSHDTATQVAKELTAHDAFAAHAEAELGLDPEDINNPVHAALSSALAFLVGGLIPILFVSISGASLRVPVTFIAVVIALIITGYSSAAISDTNKTKAVIRVVAGGVLAMVITFLIGHLIGTTTS